ncbi:MAG: C25 family cysteine peptidase, partial [Planctomycetota bacterium]
MSRVCRIVSLFLFAGLVALGLTPSVYAHGANHVDKNISYDSLERTVINFHIDKFEQQTIEINGAEYTSLHIPGAAYVSVGHAGQPMLPSLTESLMIPDLAAMKVNVLSSEYYEISGIQVAPSKGTIYRSVDPASVPYVFGSEYEKDAFYPGNLTHQRAPHIIHDVRGQVIEIYPFQYNPVKNILRVYNHIEIEVVADGISTENVIDRSKNIPNRPDQSFEVIYQNLFSNYAGNRTEPGTEDGSLLVISHGAFMSAMQPLVDWKNSIGINTTMVDVATIGNNSTAIKNYITGIYNQGNLSFVLLVGDGTEVKTGTYSYAESDPWYSTITADKYPDIFVGRFSAQTTAQVNTQVQRTIEYEQAGHDVTMGGWNARGLGVASDQGSGAGHYGESDNQHVELVRSELLAYGYTQVDQSYDPTGTTTKIRNALNNGVRNVTYCGHGYTQGWGNGGGFSNTDVDALTNVGMLPFVSSVACYGGDFDGTTSFGEAWLRATHNGSPTGAVGAYCSSISQSWAEPMYGQANHQTGGKYGGVDRYWTEMNWSLGGCWFGGGCCMLDLAGTTGQEMFMTWNIFGDPSLRLTGTSGPQTLKADRWDIPVNNPIDAEFSILLGSECGGYNYCIVTGLSGNSPGTVLPGGLVCPINFDAWTYFGFAYMNALPLFTDFYGTLDSIGEAKAHLITTG